MKKYWLIGDTHFPPTKTQSNIFFILMNLLLLHDINWLRQRQNGSQVFILRLSQEGLSFTLSMKISKSPEAISAWPSIMNSNLSVSTSNYQNGLSKKLKTSLNWSSDPNILTFRGSFSSQKLKIIKVLLWPLRSYNGLVSKITIKTSKSHT